MALDPKSSVVEDDVDFIQTARDRYKAGREADREDRESAELDVRFESGGIEGQWTPAAIELRTLTEQPILVWNRLHTFVQQVSNDGRENKPSVMAIPGDGGNPHDAELLQDRIRQIEYESNADVAYDTSRDQQIICGRGHYRVITEYASPTSRRQVARIKPILDQFCVVWDPNAKEYDKSDANWCFVRGVYSKAAYKRKFGKKTKLSEVNFFADTDNEVPDWVNIGPNGEDVLVCEYWVKEYRPRTLCETASGEMAWKDELPEQAVIVWSEERQDWDVCQYIIDGIQVLSKTKWLGKIISIVPLFGRQEVVNGKLRNISLIRHSHDAQRLVNLFVSNIAGAVGQSPKTPMFLWDGQDEGHEEELGSLNVIPRAYQLLKPIVKDGVLLPPPQMNHYEPPVQVLVMGLREAVDNLKASMNIYDASLGNAPADASGLAINARNKESDMGNFHFSDNESRSRKLLGRILLELIPKLDAGKDSIPVRTVDGKSKHVPLRRAYTNHDGKTVTHNLDEGSYEPHITTGPSYTSARQQASAFYTRLAETDKSFMQLGGDVMFRAMDVPGAEQLAERYEKMLPTQLKPAGDPTQLQGKLQQSMQMIQQLSETIHQLKDQIESKQPELETRKQIAAMQEETKREALKVQAEIALAKLTSGAGVAQLNAEIGAIQHSIETTNEQASQEFDQLLAHLQSVGAIQGQDDEQGQPDDQGVSQQDDSAPAAAALPTGTDDQVSN